MSVHSSAPLLLAFPQPLLQAQFIKREKRFLAHMRLEDGSSTIAHCANTGSMRNLQVPDAPCLIWDAQNPKRRLQYSWLATQPHPGTWVGIHTPYANTIAINAITRGLIPGISQPTFLKAEKTLPSGSRLDIYLHAQDGTPWYIEVKNVTLVEKRVARFPDAVTTRGQKHLDELMHLVREGRRAAMLYVVQRNDADSFEAAADIDALYAEKLQQALSCGVDVHVLGTTVSPQGIHFRAMLPLTSAFGLTPGAVSP